MSSQSYSCSACHGPLTIENRFEKSVKCTYCGTINFIHDENTDLTGQTGDIAEFSSIFVVGKKISFGGKNGTISARMQYEYEDGTWDEFYIVVDSGEKYWLQEDEGELTLFTKKSLTSSIAKKDEIFPGDVIEINGENFFVTEKSEARIKGTQGKLPYTVDINEKITCIDGNISGKIASIEISPSEIFYSEGKNMDYDDFEIS